MGKYLVLFTLVFYLGMLNPSVGSKIIKNQAQDTNTNDIKQPVNSEVTMKELQSEILQLKQQLTDDIAEVKYKCAQLGSLQDEYKQQIQHLQQDNRMLRKYMIELKDSIKLEGSVIGFTACANETRTYNASQRVRFDSAVANEGEAYDPLISSFRCPYSGFYFFHVSARAATGYFFKAFIRKEGSVLTNVASNDNLGSTSSKDQGSNLILTHCEEGQLVFVEAVDNSNDMRLYGGCGSSFSGYLLRLDV